MYQVRQNIFTFFARRKSLGTTASVCSIRNYKPKRTGRLAWLWRAGDAWLRLAGDAWLLLAGDAWLWRAGDAWQFHVLVFTTNVRVDVRTHVRVRASTCAVTTTHLVARGSGCCVSGVGEHSSQRGGRGSKGGKEGSMRREGAKEIHYVTRGRDILTAPQ